MKTIAVKLAVAFGLLSPHYVHFAWQQSVPGPVIVSCGASHGGLYPLTACRARTMKCDSRKFVAGSTYFCTASEPGIFGMSNEVTFTSK